jgi:hypothetical protein
MAATVAKPAALTIPMTIRERESGGHGWVCNVRFLTVAAANVVRSDMPPPIRKPDLRFGLE